MAEQLARASNTSLDLIANQEHLVLIAECASLLQVLWVGHNDASLTLDGLDEESSEVRAGGLKGLAQGSLIIVCNGLGSSWNGASDTGQIRTVVFARLRVRR